MPETMNVPALLSGEESTWLLPTMLAKIRVGSTPLGLGVFACDLIANGTDLGEIRGTIIDDVDHQSDYCMDLGETLSLEPEPPYRYVNHSCEPNCQLVQFESGDADIEEQPVLNIEVIRDIQPGEELMIDYSWPAEEAIPCGCGTASCRGYIVDPEEVLQAKSLHEESGNKTELT